jgi:two-component system, sensor histidine kinase and response regulator
MSQMNQIIQVEGYLKIEIIDTGFGISKPNIDKLFKPFVQTHSDSYKLILINHFGRSFGGTGLGLWISKSITNLMEGDIKVDLKLKLLFRLKAKLEMELISLLWSL